MKIRPHELEEFLQCEDDANWLKGVAKSFSAKRREPHPATDAQDRCAAVLDFDLNPMPCNRPQSAWRGLGGRLVWSREKALNHAAPVVIPCGKCWGCRVDKKRSWALRIHCEAMMHDENCFVTLTYRDEPYGGSLCKPHMDKFLKNLRNQLWNKHKLKIRFFQTGEYGEKLGRPHHHAIIFGWMPSDTTLYKDTSHGKLYTSSILEKAWPHGFVTVSAYDYACGSYVAGYVTKKITGDQAEDHYQKVDTATGELFTIEPEYSTMSRRPGIGASWLDAYHTDLEKGFITVGAKKFSVPRYFSERMARMYPESYEKLEKVQKERSKELREISRKMKDGKEWRMQDAREKIIQQNLSNHVEELPCDTTYTPYMTQ